MTSGPQARSSPSYSYRQKAPGRKGMSGGQSTLELMALVALADELGLGSHHSRAK